MLSVILGEVLLMITYNICFNGELEKTNAMEHNLQECMDLVYSDFQQGMMIFLICSFRH